MNKKQWTAVIKAYIWSVASSATDFNPDDMDILCDLLELRKNTPGTEERVKAIKKTESEYNTEYEKVLKSKGV
nr:MAG TPA: hypothetical protein [Caudoviricetes sp.]